MCIRDRTVAEAKNIIEGEELSYKVYGDGDTVLSQIPEYGKSIPKNGTMVLYTCLLYTSRCV